MTGSGEMGAKKHPWWGIGSFFLFFIIIMAVIGGSLTVDRTAYDGEHVQEIIVEKSVVSAGEIVNISLRLGAFTQDPVTIELSFEHSSGFTMSKIITIKKSVIGTTNIEAPGVGTMIVKARPVGVSEWEHELTLKIVSR